MVILEKPLVDSKWEPNRDIPYFQTQKRLYQFTSNGLYPIDLQLSGNYSFKF
jgi:hypothetical protein